MANESRVLARMGDERVELDVTDARPFSLRVQGRVPPSSGQALEDVRIAFGAQEHTLGRCHLEPDPQGAHRLAPVEALVNCRDLFKHGRVVPHGLGFDQLPLLWARKDQIRPEFVAYTASLVFDLQVYREQFDAIDRAISEESLPIQEEVRARVIALHGEAFVKFFDARLAELGDLVKGFTRQEHERHGYYFRRHVWPFVVTGPIMWRANAKPRGYAGDSQMMRQAYEHAYDGETIFGRLLHRHVCDTAAAQAVRNRRRLIVEKVEALAAERKKPELHLMSIACGPAWEIRDLYADPANCKRYVSTLLDQDEEAIGEAESEITNISRKHGIDVRARYIQDSVRTMLRSKDLAAKFGRHDFIYSMGLFDYLTQPVARSVVAKLYDMLEPGGQLLVGNFHVRNPSRTYMEYWMDWVLLYRTDEEMLDLAQGIPGATATTYYEGTRSQVFLDIRKPAS